MKPGDKLICKVDIDIPNSILPMYLNKLCKGIEYEIVDNSGTYEILIASIDYHKGLWFNKEKGLSKDLLYIWNCFYTKEELRKNKLKTIL